MSYLTGLEKQGSQTVDLELGLWVQLAAGRWKNRRGKEYLPSQKKESKFEGHQSGPISMSMKITTHESTEKKIMVDNKQRE